MVKGEGRVWRGAMIAAVFAVATGCTARAPVSVSDPGTEGSDSTRIREEALIDDGRLDGVGTTDLADASNDAAVVEARGRGTGAGGLVLEAVTGSRSDARVRWAGLSGLSAGVRWCGGAVSGFAGFEGRGIVRAVYAGRMTVRGAERLILGRGMGSYVLAGSGPVRGGFAASPSFSKWYGYPGVAAAFGWRLWRVDAAALGRCGDESAFSPATFWTSVSRALAHGAAGVIVGMPAGVPSAGSSTAAGETAGASGPRVVSFFASYRVRGYQSSGEVAGVCGRVFFALRLAARERGADQNESRDGEEQRKSGLERESGGKNTRTRWSALFFDAPHGSPLGQWGLERIGRTDRGARLDIARSMGPVGCEVWVAAGRTRSESRQTAYRRLALTLSKKRTVPLWWQTSVLYRCGYEEDYPSSPVEVEISGERKHDLRLRAAVGIRSGDTVSSSVRADVLPENGGTDWGVVLVLSNEIEAGRVDAHLQVAAHSLPPGRSATLWRPGAGPFEWLFPLYGKGSDVALRVGLRVTGAGRVFLFYGSAWSGRTRAYAGFEYRH